MKSPLQEDIGLVEIHRACIGMHAIWRPTLCHDLGIDGQIEFLEPDSYISTGYIVAVQSKSGPSYFKEQDDNYIKFYPEKKHRQYWLRLKIPVILILHNPETERTYYCSVKPQLGGNGLVLVDKNNIFGPMVRGDIVECAVREYLESDPIKVLDKLYKIKLVRNGNKEITGIEFLLACTNRIYGYCEIRMRRIRALFSCLTNERGISITQEDYEYIFRNVMAIHSFKLVDDFLEEFNDVWYDLKSVPDIASPLTSFGKYVMESLWGNIGRYISMDNYAHLNMASPLEVATYVSDHAQLISNKLDASDALGIEPR